MIIKRAVAGLRDGLHYRKEAFRHGLRVIGYDVRTYISDPGPGDLLVIWNRSFSNAMEAQRFQHGGALVLVAENGLLGKGWRGGNWYSLALHSIAGAGGHWEEYGPARWDSFGVQLEPWRTGGTETIILGQRGIGEQGIRSPDNWAERTKALLGGRIRPHPGRTNASVLFEEDVANASSIVTWASSAAFKALTLGIPVWYEQPNWAGRSAARHINDWGQEPMRDDLARMVMFRRLAWCLWNIEEVDSGEAFKHVLGLR